MPSTCPNCGGHDVRHGKVVGQLDLGGGFGFRPSRRGLLGWFRPDLRIPRDWSLCGRCGMLWVFVPDATGPARADQSSTGVAGASPESVPHAPRHLVWNVGCFIPTPVRRLRRLTGILLRVMVVVVIGCAVAWTARAVQRRFFIVPGPATVAVIALALLSPWIVLAAGAFMLRRRARRIDFMMCPECGYDLRGTRSGTCPECGTTYLDEELPVVWSRAMSLNYLLRGRQRA